MVWENRGGCTACLIPGEAGSAVHTGRKIYRLAACGCVGCSLGNDLRLRNGGTSPAESLPRKRSAATRPPRYQCGAASVGPRIQQVLPGQSHGYVNLRLIRTSLALPSSRRREAGQPRPAAEDPICRSSSRARNGPSVNPISAGFTVIHQQAH